MFCGCVGNDDSVVIGLLVGGRDSFGGMSELVLLIAAVEVAVG